MIAQVITNFTEAAIEMRPPISALGQSACDSFAIFNRILLTCLVYKIALDEIRIRMARWKQLEDANMMYWAIANGYEVEWNEEGHNVEKNRAPDSDDISEDDNFRESIPRPLFGFWTAFCFWFVVFASVRVTFSLAADAVGVWSWMARHLDEHFLLATAVLMVVLPDRLYDRNQNLIIAITGLFLLEQALNHIWQGWFWRIWAVSGRSSSLLPP